MSNIKQIQVAGTTYNIEPYTSYLPLTGGTLESTTNSVPLTLKGKGTDSTGAYLGFQWGSHTGPNYFIGVERGIPYFLSGASTYSLLHNGNLKIDGVKPAANGTVINRYGKCSTGAATAAKTVSVTTGVFNLEAGARVTVQFTNKNTAGNPTLNVGGKGAKNIFHNGARITTGTNKGMLYGIVDFIYDGTQWHLIGNYVDTDIYGRTANTTSKIFLMGGTSQSSSNKTTYSNVGCYASGGYLYSNSTKVSVEGHTHSEYSPVGHTHDTIGTETSFIKASDSNEVSFGSNANYIYFGYDNRTGSTGVVDTYYFGAHSGVENCKKGRIECGTIVSNGSTVMTAANFNFSNGILTITT